MYSILSSVESFGVKNQVREQIFSLLGNSGKTLFLENSQMYAKIEISWYKKITEFISNIWHTPYKRIMTYIAIIITSVVIAPPPTSFAESSDTTTFIVTAYYSPIPGQNSYARGTLEADKKLNGNGTHGASGTPVFTGMIAAPKSYEFGTQIFFEGLGMGRVEDRGGAIVDAWVRGQPHDRIDIWMGYGDAGLKRARAWGIRQVNGTFIRNNEGLNLNYIDLEGISNGRVNLANFPTTKAQSQGGISAEIIEAFAELGYIVEGGNLKDMIYRFQVDQGIVASMSEEGAGNFGPKTKAAFSEEYKKYTNLKRIDIEAIEQARKELLDERTAWDVRYQKAQNSVQALSTIKRGENSHNVLVLQSILSEEGFFKGKKDGKMKVATILALRKYQKANGIKQTGNIDTSTKEALVTDMLEA